MDNLSAENDIELCFVCCAKFVLPNENDQFLGRNLLVIFLLKNVMQVPDDQLEENLRSYGNPVDWIRLCEECCHLARQAFYLHCQVVRIDRELWSVQNLIVEKAKSSCPFPEADDRKDNIWGRTRKYLRKSNFQSGSLPVNPFIEGDKLAKANLYLRQEISIGTLKFSHNCTDNPDKLANSSKIKTEQLNLQQISGNEGNDDDDWQQHDSDNDKLNYQSSAAAPVYLPSNVKIEQDLKSDSYSDDEDNMLEKRTKAAIKIGIKKTKKIARKKYRQRINGKIKCYYCDKVFARTTGCLKHENEKHAKIPAQFSCHICGETWNSKEYLSRHLMNAHKTDSQPKVVIRKMDSVPTNKFKKQAPPKFRERINGKIKCYYCDKVFANTSGCCRHENEKHATIPAQFPCDICDRVWNSREYLMSHRTKAHKIELTEKKDNLPKFDKSLSLIDEDDVEIPLSMEPVLSCQKEHLDENQIDIDNPLISTPKVKTELVPDNDEDFCDNVMASDANDLQLEDVRSIDDSQCVSTPMTRTEENSIICSEDNEDMPNKKIEAINKKVPLSKRKKRASKKLRERIDGKIKCFYCDKLFKKTTGCYRHENEKHAKTPAQFRCDICDKAWNSKEYLSRHLTRTHGIKLSEKMEHYPETEIVGDDNQVEIDSPLNSSNEVESKPDYDEMEREDDDDLQLEDVRSADEDEDEDVVQQNMSKAMGTVLLNSTRKPLRKTRERINGKVKCYYCNELFDNLKSCCRHETLSHSNIAGRFSCDICGRNFGLLFNLERHKLIHTNKDKRFGCKYCEMKFRDKYGLGRHERSHKNERRRIQKSQQSKMTDWRKLRDSKTLEWVDGKVKCGTCDKLFATAANLRNHETSHKFKELVSKTEGEDEKDQASNFFQFRKKRTFEWVDGKLKCGFCDKLFSSDKGLVSHEKQKHLSEKGEFICEMCGKVCTTLFTLRSHKRWVHKLKADGSQGESRTYTRKNVDKEGYGLTLKNGKGKRGKNYLRVDGKLKCNFCERLFISADGLYKHEREKHPKKPGEFICTNCGMTFNSMDYLRKHTERKHWMRMDGSPYVPPWVATRKYKWKASEK